MSLSQICMVMDMDGFHVLDKFYPREVAYVSLTENDWTESYRFKLNHLVPHLTEKNWKTVNFCKKYIHGLTFKSLPGERDLFHVENLETLVKNAYICSKRKERDLVAYKGGQVEKELLKKLDIPSINLEDYGCPKYDNLPEPDVKDCGFHIAKKLHCPKKECTAFATWIKKQID